MFAGLPNQSPQLTMILLTWSLPVYQNAHVNSVCEKVSFHFILTVPQVTFINTKGNSCLEELNKYTLSVGMYVSCVTVN